MTTKLITPGAYYFGGWSGRSKFADDPTQPWARNAPTHLTRRMVEEFPEREPVWGWREDSLEIMERQIDLAADHGLAFFAFCWYWYRTGHALDAKAIKAAPMHTALDLFLKARNNRRMKFCLLVANHEGFEIKGSENWRRAGEFWLPYLTHRQHLTVSGKPLIIVFDTRGGDREGFAAMNEMALKRGLAGLSIAGCGGGSLADGYTHHTRYNFIPHYSAGPLRHTYAELAASFPALWSGSVEQPYIPLVSAGWDCRPWEGPTGLSGNLKPSSHFVDRTPEQFAELLKRAAEWMDQHPDRTTEERLMLIYAWNEFGEGGYIAPTKGDSDGKYLKALRSVALPTSRSGRSAAQSDRASRVAEPARLRRDRSQGGEST